MEYKTNPWTIILTVVLTTIVGGGFFLWQSQNTNTEEPAVIEENNETKIVVNEVKEPEAPQASKATKTYTSEVYALSFEYPDDWTVYEDVAQLDVQPPQPAQWSNYFTLEILDSKFSPNKSLEDYISARDLKKTDFTIDGQNVYTESNTGAAGTMLYFLFSHQDKVYQLHLFETWYDMSEVQAMIASLQLN
ncbi:hypothetical protein COU74_02920 [Candidatus Peregrinibacteria bacterium CG10_big_fil_rev_8_21_14_0_10_36_19]|nr:MAG: hypothetical protein COU74_02920 [Candidatus Peregrinibacteria bacterium CG10_big_fil_rev_8_21_14_0_10_36_19]